MEGLEISVLELSRLNEVETFRFDSDYFLKKYIHQNQIIKSKIDYFPKLIDLNLKIDASAFYPSLEPYYNTGSLPFIRVQNVNDFIDYENCVTIPEFVVNSDAFSTLNVITKGDIVITKGGSIGRVALVDRPTAVTRDLIYINSSKMNRRDYIFLYIYLTTNFSFDLMVQSSSMTAQPHLTLTLVKNIPVFNPSVNFKNVIFDIYERLLEKRNLSQQKYAESENLLLEILGLQDFQPSAEAVNVKSFKEIFATTGRLDAEYYQPKYDDIEEKLSKKNTRKLNDVFEILSSPSPSKYLEEGIKVIKTKNIRIPNVDIENISDYTDETKLLVQKDDLLFASMGVGSLGRVSYINNELVNCTIDGTIKLFRTKEVFKNENIEIPTMLFLTSKIGQELIYKYVIGSTGIISISKENIENLLIPQVNQVSALQLTTLVLESQQLKAESERLLEIAKRAVEIAIEENEEEALKYINENS